MNADFFGGGYVKAKINKNEKICSHGLGKNDEPISVFSKNSNKIWVGARGNNK